MIDLAPTPEQEALCTAARRFARDVVRPAERALDALPDPAAVFASPHFTDTLRRACDLGLHRMGVRESSGGLGLDPVTQVLVWEELAAGGVGLAATLTTAPVAVAFVDRIAGHRADLVDAFVRPFCEDTDRPHLGAWAGTEAAVGSDASNYDDPTVHHHVRATADGDTWVLDGSKASFVSNGGLADLFLVFASVHPERGIQGSGLFLVPADAGLGRGQPLDKVGLRALNQAAVTFDGVRIPADHLLVPPGPTYPLFHTAMKTVGNLAVAALAVGLLRSAYEEAITYARDRVQFGRPVLAHQAPGFRLVDCATDLEAARGLVLKAAWTLARSPVGDLKLSSMARVFATEAALRHATALVETLGAYGISREYPAEKAMRDARVLALMDAPNDVVRRDVLLRL